MEIEKKKVGRKPIPKEQKRVQVGASIRPDQLIAWQTFGGSQWLQRQLDEHTRLKAMFDKAEKTLEAQCTGNSTPLV